MAHCAHKCIDSYVLTQCKCSLKPLFSARKKIIFTQAHSWAPGYAGLDEGSLNNVGFEKSINVLNPSNNQSERGI